MRPSATDRELLDRLAAECREEAERTHALAATRRRIASLLVELNERRVSDVALAHAVLRGRGVAPSLRLVIRARKAVRERRLRARHRAAADRVAKPDGNA